MRGKTGPKKFVFGSKEKVDYGLDKGSFATVFCCFTIIIGFSKLVLKIGGFQ